MREHTQRLGLDLPDPLARHAELLFPMLERAVVAHPDPEAHPRLAPTPPGRAGHSATSLSAPATLRRGAGRRVDRRPAPRYSGGRFKCRG